MQAPKIHLREGGGDDAEELIALNKLCNDAAHINADTESVRDSLKNNSDEVVFVATRDEKIIGFASLRLCRSFCYEKASIEITELFVMEKRRRMKIATLLIKKILKYAAQKNILEVHLRVNKNNRAAIKFYQSCGLDETNHMVFRIRYDND